MRSLNRVMLIGHLASDPEVRETPSGYTVSNFPLVTNRQWKNSEGEMKEEANFHRVVTWRGLAENCVKFLKKGSGVYVEGRLVHRKVEDKEGRMRYFTEVVAETVNFLRGKRTEANAV